MEDLGKDVVATVLDVLPVGPLGNRTTVVKLIWDAENASQRTAEGTLPIRLEAKIPCNEPTPPLRQPPSDIPVRIQSKLWTSIHRSQNPSLLMIQRIRAHLPTLLMFKEALCDFLEVEYEVEGNEDELWKTSRVVATQTTQTLRHHKFSRLPHKRTIGI